MAPSDRDHSKGECAMMEREVRTECVLKLDKKRNAPKFVEQVLVKAEVDVTSQGCWSENNSSTYVHISQQSLYLKSLADLASFCPFMAFSFAMTGPQLFSWQLSAHRVALERGKALLIYYMSYKLLSLKISLYFGFELRFMIFPFSLWIIIFAVFTWIYTS